MKPAFYDISIPYDENFEKGPPITVQDIKLPKRTIVKKFPFLESELNLPFGIPAGPLLNSKFIKAAFEWGFDVVHYKTQRSVVFPCNQYPNVLFVDVDGDLTLEKTQKHLVASKDTSKDVTEFSITNSFGNPSRGPQVWQEDMKKALSYEDDGQLLIASVVGTIQEDFTEDDYFNDFAHTAELAAQTGVKTIEINLSCPNVANEGIICYTPHAVEQICKRTKEKIGNIPLLVKFGYFSQAQQDLLEDVVKRMSPFVAGIAVINTLPAAVVDENGNQALPGPNRLKSGICGASIKWAGIDMVKRLDRLKEKYGYDYAIIGVGGVMTPEDYFDYRKSGADIVQSATAAMWNPYLAHNIWKKEMEKDNLLTMLGANA